MDYCKDIYEKFDGDLFAIEQQLKFDFNNDNKDAVCLLSPYKEIYKDKAFEIATQVINICYNQHINA